MVSNSYFNISFLKFLESLSQNNNKLWFEDNRQWYENDVKKPFEAFANDLLERLMEVDHDLYSDARKCIFRINRDIRFSSDKSPYKVNRSLAFSKLGKKDIDNPGYYLELNPQQCMIAGGAYKPDKDKLKMIRQEIYYNYDQFIALTNEKKFKKYYGTLRGELAKRLIGSEAEYAAEYPILYQKQYYFMLHFDPQECLKPDFLKFCTERMLAGYDINLFLRRAMSEV